MFTAFLIPALFLLEPTAAFPSRRGDDIERLALQAREAGSVRVLVRTTSEVRAGASGDDGTAALAEREIAASARRVLDRLKGLRIGEVHVFRTVPLIALDADEEAIRTLAAVDGVEGIWEDVLLRAAVAESAPLIGAPAQWAAGHTGAGETIAILDTGIDASHPFLKGRVVEEACFSSNWPLSKFAKLRSACPKRRKEMVGRGAARPCADKATCSHGTHVAGIAAGNGAGMSGIAPEATLIAVQVFSLLRDRDACMPLHSPCAVATLSDVAKGLEHVATLRDRYSIAAVNLSVGSPTTDVVCDDSPLKPLVDQLRRASIATIVAAGNGGSDTYLDYPACISSTVSVGNTTDADEVHPTSNRGPMLRLHAPGADIVSSVPGGRYEPHTGTSMSAPHVAGAWALLRPQLTHPTVDNVLFRLRLTGKPIADTTGYGTSRINLEWALDPDVVRLADGGFEDPAAGAWREVPEAAHSLIHADGEPGLPVPPAAGSRLAWLGGSPFTRDRLVQNVYFPPGRGFSLRFQIQIVATAADCGTAAFRVTANGVEAHREPLCAAAGTGGWVQREVSLTPGHSSLELSLETWGDPSGGAASVFLDEVSLVENAPPDLIPAPRLSGAPSTPVIAGHEARFTVEAWAASWGEPIEVLLSWGDGTTSGWIYGDQPASVLTARKAWSAPGRYEIRARARSWILKSVQSDWSEPLEIDVQPSIGPDLTGAPSKLQHTCKVVERRYLQCTLKMEIAARNIGWTESPATTIQLLIVKDPRVLWWAYAILDVPLEPLAPGQERRVAVEWKIEKNWVPTGYYIVAVIDPGSQAAESDETNNDIAFSMIP